MKGTKNRVLSLLIAILLSACGSQVIKKQDPALVSLEYGYVHAIYPLRGTMGIREINTNKKYDFVNEQSHVQGWGGNGIWLPPGEYKIDSWMGIALEEYPSFDVEKGRFTDLGSLIPLSVGNYEFVLLPHRHSELEEISNAKLNELYPYLSIMETIKWTSKIPPKPSKDTMQGTGLGLIADLLMAYDRKVNNPGLNSLLRSASTTNEFYDLAKKGVRPLDFEPTTDENGNLYYGADLGQIRVRSIDGSWDSIDTGRIVPVTAVEWFEDQLLVGFDDGLISVLDHTGSWKHLASTDEFSIVDIDRTSDSWVVVATKYENSRLTETVIYSGKGRLPTNLIENRRFTPKNSPFIPRPHGEASGQYYFFSIFPGLHILDTETLRWEKITTPGDIHSFHVSGDTVVAYKSQGAFSKVYLSLDSGKSWDKISRPPYHIWNVNFSEGSKGTASRTKSKAFSVELQFYEYSPEENLWKYLYSAPHGCNGAPLLDANNDSRFCVTANGDILNYSDGKWEIEYLTN